MSFTSKLFSPFSRKEENSSGDAENVREELKNFIGKSPRSKYTFDSERDAPQSQLCRESGEKGRECIMIRMQSKKLFEAMQDNGFFCALPDDPSRTYIECTPMPKT